MKRSDHITAFYVEVLLMMVVVTGIVLVLTHVFALGSVESSTAKYLTNAVCLAENAAEAVSASGSPAELQSLLDEGGNTAFVENAAVTTLRAVYDADMRPAADGGVVVDVTWDAAPAGTGDLVRSTITVSDGEDSVIYTLDTAVYHGEEDG